MEVPKKFLDWRAEAAAPIVPVQGNFRRKVNGSWAAGDLMEKVEDLFHRMPADEPDQSFQHYLDRTGASEEVKQQALGYVGGFHAADPSLISVHSLIRDNQAEEAIQGDLSSASPPAMRAWCAPWRTASIANFVTLP